MPIIAAFIIALVALAYAGYWIYTLVAAQFGVAMGYGAVVLAAGFIVLLIMQGFKRYYRLHGKALNKQRVLVENLSHPNSSIQLEPNQKSGLIQLEQQPELHFIFADIQHVQLQGTQVLQLQLRGNTEPIPLAFKQPATAKLWLKRLQLAAEQKL